MGPSEGHYDCSPWGFSPCGAYGPDSPWRAGLVAGCASNRSKRGSPLSGAHEGSIVSHAGDLKYGFASSESSWSSARGWSPTAT
jgi:hypothetical protein